MSELSKSEPIEHNSFEISQTASGEFGTCETTQTMSALFVLSKSISLTKDKVLAE